MATGERPGRTATFTHTFRLEVDGGPADVLGARFDAATRLYNDVLAECFRRARRMRESRLWTRARRLRADPQQRAELFQQAREAHGFRLFDLFPFVAGLRAGELGHHLDSNTARGVAVRAFHAVNDWILHRRGRPRFKSRRRGLRSVGGTCYGGIRLAFAAPAGADPLTGCEVRWTGLRLHLRFRHGRSAARHSAGHRRVIEHALGHRIKFVRILRKTHGTRVRWYAQLVLQGNPLCRVPAGDEVVGWDLGVSTSAWVGATKAALVPFAPGLRDQRRRFRRLQRRIDRQRRAGNPEHYHPDGTVQPGRKRWRVSARQAEVERRLADGRRRQAEQRRNENNRLANRIVATGRFIRTEDVHVGSWTRMFGRQVGRSAPAGALQAVTRKAESAGGHVDRLPLRLACSQTCVCGAREPKALSQRVHHCPHCGLRMQRDLLSAFLARCTEATVLHAGRVRETWPAAEPLLRAAWRDAQSASAPGVESPGGHRNAVGADRARSGTPVPSPPAGCREGASPTERPA